MNKTFKLIIAVFAMIVLVFISCDDTVHEQERPDQVLELEFTVGEDSLVNMVHGETLSFSAAVNPPTAIVQTLIWGFPDEESGEFLSIRRPGSASSSGSVTGNSIVVTADFSGEARIVVAALGGSGTIQSVITVRVDGIGLQIADLLEMDELPQSIDLTTVVANETLRPNLLCFDGENIEITLKSRETYSDTITLADPGAMFTLGEGVTLTLDNITLMGRAANTGNALVIVDGGNLEMNEGSAIKGNVNNATGIPGIGGGVRVNSGTFTMNAGQVSGNTALRGGGVHVAAGAVFEMHDDAVITGNVATAVYTTSTTLGAGAGVHNNGTFNMHGGEISKNITQSLGGGVFNNGTFNMHGGEISDNEASHGGGVRINIRSEFSMDDGAVISGNEAEHNGGGIDNRGTFTMFGGEISNNTAMNLGGGMHIDGAGATLDGADTAFYMHDGIIFGNTARDGGGIRNWAAAIFIENGVIYGRNELEAGGLRNNAASFASLSVGGDHTTQYGFFDNNGDFDDEGDLSNSSFTIRIEDGVSMRPERAGDLDIQLLWLHSFAAAGETYIVEINEDQTIPPVSAGVPVTATNLPARNTRIIIRGIGGQRTVSLDDVGHHFRVLGGVTLELENIILQGRPDNVTQLVRVDGAGSTFIMREGSMITGNVNRATGTGATPVVAEGGSAVRVANQGTFILDGGIISGNTIDTAVTVTHAAANGAAVNIANGGRFDMRSGYIRGNTAGLHGGGVFTAAGAAGAGQIFVRIGGGTIYGVDAVEGTANVSRSTGGAVSAALFITPGANNFVHHGTFTGDVWTEEGELFTSNHTISVLNNGNLDTPPRTGDIANQLAWLRAFAQSGQSYPIYISGNDTLHPDLPVALTSAPTLPAGRTGITITLRSSAAGTRRNITLPSEAVAANQGSLFVVPAGVTLVLDDYITLQGRDGTGLAGNIWHLVRVENGGTLRMNAGSVITGNNNTSATAVNLGGGVRVNAGGTLNMYGGTISDNTAVGGTGAGVHVAGTAGNPGTVNMNSGKITGNTATGATSAGGVFLAAGGRFNMNGGEISDNTSSGATSAGGVTMAAGTATNQTIFNMFDGTIHGNQATNTTNTASAGGVRIGGGNAFFNMRGVNAAISGNHSDSLASAAAGNSAGGVLVLTNGLFQISDGIIYGSDEPDTNLRNTTAAETAFAFDTLFRATAATGAQRGTFDNEGVFTPDTTNADLGNSNITIEVKDGDLI